MGCLENEKQSRSVLVESVDERRAINSKRNVTRYNDTCNESRSIVD